MPEDARIIALREDPSIGRSFVQALFGALYEVVDSTVSLYLFVLSRYTSNMHVYVTDSVSCCEQALWLAESISGGGGGGGGFPLCREWSLCSQDQFSFGGGFSLPFAD